VLSSTLGAERQLVVPDGVKEVVLRNGVTLEVVECRKGVDRAYDE